MKRKRSLKLFAVWSLVAVLISLLALALALNQDGRRRGESRSMAGERVLFGVLGDSDSAAYHDSIVFPASGPQPGGEFHAITFQWPEVLAQIRAHQADLGEWAVWGVPRWLSMARVRDGLGLPWRGPQRETHQHNLAWASKSDSLTSGAWRQVQRLVDIMDEQPAHWRRGVVVIRSGVNNFGKVKALGALAKNPDDPEVLATIASCVSRVRQAVRLIHKSHSDTRIVLVGILNNADWPPYFDLWQSRAEQVNLNRGLDHFDAALKEMAEHDPRLAFFDDRAWFAKHWGRRGADTGRPEYQPVRIGPGLLVTNTMGDSPEHAVLANGHAGLAWNVLWVQHLVDIVRNQFGVAIDGISDGEVQRFVEACIRENR